MPVMNLYLLAILVRRFCVPVRWHDVVLLTGGSVTTTQKTFKHALHHVFAKCRDRIQKLSLSFLTDDRLVAYAEAFHKKGAPYCRLTS